MDEGWIPLLVVLLEEIGALVRDDDAPTVRLLFVGQKLGGLRVQVAPYVPAVAEAIARAEAKAWHTCERCGAPGVLPSSRPFVQVLCNACEGEAAREERLRRSGGW